MSGERTCSAAVNTTLNAVVRQHEFWKAFGRFAKEAAKGGFFDPEYVKERWPEASAPPKKNRSARKRLPRTKVK